MWGGGCLKTSFFDIPGRSFTYQSVGEQCQPTDIVMFGLSSGCNCGF